MLLKPGDIFLYKDIHGEISGLVVSVDYGKIYCLMFAGGDRLAIHEGRALRFFWQNSMVYNECIVIASLD